jgi:dTDP-4-amino-4,6-dideoxygalactose transaminase
LKVEFYKHNLGAEENQKVLECLSGIFLTTGQYVKDFESRFAQYLGLKHVIGLTSCTAALHLSLLGLDIGPGDEVITTPMTFIATANAILYVGATPVFIDIDPQTGLMDPHLIEAAITPSTKAIIPVHLYGQMCDMKAISGIARKHNLKIIEDCAHCVEGIRDGVRPGQLSDAACYSFYATKNLTCGEGGAVGCNDDRLAERILLLRQHGMSKSAADR